MMQDKHNSTRKPPASQRVGLFEVNTDDTVTLPDML